MVVVFAFIFTFLAAAIEASVWPVPLTLLTVVFFGIVSKKSWVFLLAIIAGIVLDSLTFQTIGIHSVFLLCMLAVLFLYGRKFETDHVFFGVIFTTLVSLIYVLFFGDNQLFFTIGSMILLSAMAFIVRSLLSYTMTRRSAL